MKKDLAIFEGHEIRRLYDETTETWFFSVVDIIRVLTQSDYQAARKYWKVLKGRLAKEGSQLVTNCYQLKLPAADGKSYFADATGMAENQTAAKTGGKIAKRARLELESKTGRRVVTGENYLPPGSVKKLRKGRDE
jgi:hypothetical protein